MSHLVARRGYGSESLKVKGKAAWKAVPPGFATVHLSRLVKVFLDYSR